MFLLLILCFVFGRSLSILPKWIQKCYIYFFLYLKTRAFTTVFLYGKDINRNQYSVKGFNLF